MEVTNVSWNEKKELLCFLITQVSNNYGGDEKEFLDEYCKELVIKYKDDLDTAIECFADLAKQRST